MDTSQEWKTKTPSKEDLVELDEAAIPTYLHLYNIMTPPKSTKREDMDHLSTFTTTRYLKRAVINALTHFVKNDISVVNVSYTGEVGQIFFLSDDNDWKEKIPELLAPVPEHLPGIQLTEEDMPGMNLNNSFNIYNIVPAEGRRTIDNISICIFAPHHMIAFINALTQFEIDDVPVENASWDPSTVQIFVVGDDSEGRWTEKIKDLF